MLIWNSEIFVKVVLLYLATNVGVLGYTAETNLRSNLSTGYDTFVRPTSPTIINFMYNLRSLQELDIAEQKMSLTGWLTLFWDDSRFVWNSAHYDNIQDIEIKWGWRPQFVITNAADGFSPQGNDDTKTWLRVFSNGKVRWNQLLATVTTCEVDISKFPFDTQTCEIELIFWYYTRSEIQLNAFLNQVYDGVYLENAEWILDNTSVNISDVTLCCPTSTASPVLRFYLTFTRRRPFYIMNFIFPTVLLSVCMVWVFLLPTESGERLGFALTVLLAYTVQLSIIATLMPTTSKQTPRIAVYLLTILILCAVVTCNVVLNVKLFYKSDPVYDCVQTIYRKVYPVVFMTCFTKVKCRKKTATDQVEKLNNTAHDTKMDLQKQSWKPEVASEDESDSDNSVEEVTWTNVSVLCDRVCFYSYFIGVAIVNGLFLDTIS